MRNNQRWKRNWKRNWKNPSKKAAAQTGWQDVLTGDVPLPAVAIVQFDGGRIGTRKMGGAAFETSSLVIVAFVCRL